MTELVRHMQENMNVVQRTVALPLAKFFLKTPFHGAQTTLFCTLDDSIANDSGRYYTDCNYGKFKSKWATDDNAAKRLWELSEKLVKL